MALTLTELCAGTQKNYGMVLIAGKGGVNNVVQWVYYIEGGETPRFLHGYELVFTTGMENNNTEWLIRFTKKLHEYGACGLVVNLGPYVKDVPQEVIDYCNTVNLPLYTIPWETRIVDITYELCHHIITDEKINKNRADTFIFAINNPLKEEVYKPELEKEGFTDGEKYAFAAVKIDTANEEIRENIVRSLRYSMAGILNGFTRKYSIVDMDKYVIVVCQGISAADFENSIKEQTEVLNGTFSDRGIYAGIAPYETDGNKLSKAYRLACGTAKLAKSYNKIFLCYDAIGMYKLLMEVDEKSSLMNYYEDCLGKLIEFDRKNNTDYLNTLRCYLENESSVAEVAKITFVHRNTVNYKIKKIKEILGCELSQNDKLKLSLAFCVERIM